MTKYQPIPAHLVGRGVHLDADTRWVLEVAECPEAGGLGPDLCLLVEGEDVEDVEGAHLEAGHRVLHPRLPLGGEDLLLVTNLVLVVFLAQLHSVTLNTAPENMQNRWTTFGCKQNFDVAAIDLIEIQNLCFYMNINSLNSLFSTQHSLLYS